jgi:hypothetical protein
MLVFYRAGLVAGAAPKVSTLTDDFSGSLTKWVQDDTSGGTASIVNGQLSLPVTPTSPYAYNSILSATAYDVTNSSVYVQMTWPYTTGANMGREAGLALYSAANPGPDHIMLFKSGANLVMRVTTGGVDNDTSVATTSTTDRWLKFIHDGTNLLLQSSNDGSTWTTRRTVTPPSWLTNAKVQIYAGDYRSTAPLNAPFTATFDNLNTAPIAATLSRRVVGPTGLIKTVTNGTSSVRLKVGTDSAVTANVQYTSAVTPDTLGNASHNTTGLTLTAGTTYYYRVELTPSSGAAAFLDTDTQVGMFKATPTGQTSFGFSFGSCEDTAAPTTYLTMAQQADDLFFHLGDLWYDDGAAQTVASFRQHMGDKLSESNHQRVFARRASTFTPSDHDAGMQDTGNGSTQPTAMANYNSVYRENMPVTTPSNGVYHTFAWGRVRFIVLDTRTFASDPGSIASTAGKVKLGATQEAWLQSTLQSMTEQVAVIISADYWTGPATDYDDSWLGYDVERQRIATMMQNTGKNIVILTGDMHAVAADNGTNSPGGFTVFGAAPFDRTTSLKGAWSNGPYPTSANAGPRMQMYGHIDIVDSGTTITLNYEGRDAGGPVRITQSKSFDLSLVTKASTDSGAVSVSDTSDLQVPKASTLIEDFSTGPDALLDPSASQTWASQAVTLYAGSNYPAKISYGLYDLTESAVSVNMNQRPQGTNNSSEAYLIFNGNGGDWNNRAYIGWSAGYFIMSEQVAGVVSTTSVAANADNFFRIRHTSGTLYWETSPDGISWTVRRTKAAGAVNYSKGKIAIQAGNYTNDPAPGSARFDDVNVLPAAPVAKTANDFAAIAVAEIETLSTSTQDDGGSISVAETASIFATISRTDTGSVATTEISSATGSAGMAGVETTALGITDQATSLFVTLSTTDTAAVSVAESRTQFATFSRTDTGSISVADTSSVAGQITSIAAAEAGAVSVSEIATIVVSMSAADFASVAVAEIETTSNSTQDDGGSIAIAETSSAFIAVSTADTAAVSVTEASNANSSSTYAGIESNGLGITEQVVTLVTSTATESNSLSVAETRTQAVTFSSTDTTAVSAADVSAATKNLTATDTGAVSVAETTSGAVIGTTSDTGSVSIAETASTGGTATVAGTESIGLGIVESATIFVTSTATDFAAFSLVELEQNFVNNPDEVVSISVSEISSVQVGFSAVDAGAVAVAETNSRFLTFTSNDQNSLAVTEVSNANSSSTVPTMESNSIGVTEQTSIFVTSTATESNSLSTSEATTSTVSQNRTDTAAVSVADVSASAITVSRADTGAVSVADASATFKAVIASDTGSVSASDISSVASTSPANENVSVAVTEQSTTFTSSAASESNSLSTVEVAANAVTQPSADSGSITVSDDAVLFKVLTATETGSLAVSESTSGYNTIDSSDTGTIMVTENSSMSGNALTTGTDSAGLGIVDMSTTYVTSTRTDTGTISVSDVAALFITKIASDTVAVSVAETRVNNLFTTSTDAGAVSVLDVSGADKTLAASDTGAVSLTESKNIDITTPGQDDIGIGISEDDDTFVKLWTNVAPNSTYDTVTGSLVSPYYNTALAWDGTQDATGNGGGSVRVTAASVDYGLRSAGAIFYPDVGNKAPAIVDGPVLLGFKIKGPVGKQIYVSGRGQPFAGGNLVEGLSSQLVNLTGDWQTVRLAPVTYPGTTRIGIQFRTAQNAAADDIYYVDDVEIFYPPNDAAAISIAESRALQVSLSAFDGGSLAVTEDDASDLTSTRGDAGAISVVETSAIFKTLVASDTGSIASTEVSSGFITGTTTDTGSLTVTEVTNASGDAVLSGTDTVTIGVDDQAVTFITGTANDAASVSISETTAVYKTIVASESNSLAVAETTASALTSTRSDAGAISIAEVTSGSVTASASDSGSIATSEISAVASTSPGNDSFGLGVSEQAAVYVTSATSDSGSVSVTDVSVQYVNSAATDTSAVSVAEARTSSLSSARSDTGAVSVSDASLTFKTMASADAGSVAIVDMGSFNNAAPTSENIAIGITEQAVLFVTVSTNESTALGVDESIDSYITVSVADQANVSVVEDDDNFLTTAVSDQASITATEASAPTKAILSSDSAAVSVGESSARGATSPASDTAGLGISETRTILVTQSVSELNGLAIAESRTIANSFARADAGAVGVNESTQSTLSQSTTDASGLAVIEDTLSYRTLETSETSFLGVLDGATLNGGAPGNDEAVIILNDTSSLFKTLVASDSGSIVASEVQVSNLASTATDTGAVSVAEARIQVATMTRTDTGSIAAADASASFKTATAVDAGAVSVADSSNSFRTLVASDTSALVVTEAVVTGKPLPANEYPTIAVDESSALVVSGSLFKASDDAASIAVDEAQDSTSFLEGDDIAAIFGIEPPRLIARTSSSTDAGSLAVTEAGTVFKTISASEVVSIGASEITATTYMAPGTDTSGLRVTEDAVIMVSGLLTKSAGDTAGVSANDTASTFVRLSSVDGGSIAGADEIHVFKAIFDTDYSIIGDTETHGEYVDQAVEDHGSIEIVDTRILNANEGLRFPSAEDRLTIGLGEAKHRKNVNKNRPDVVEYIETESTTETYSTGSVETKEYFATRTETDTMVNEQTLEEGRIETWLKFTD